MNAPIAQPASIRTRSARRLGALAAIGLAALLVAATQWTITGGWYGLYLLERSAGRPLELKDDLLLGDGPRLLGGISFSPLRELLRGRSGAPSLDLDWDAAEGEGVVTSRFENGDELRFFLSRFLAEDGSHPRGVFVGGAASDVAATPEQSESGIALRDAAGWHHVWCNVNELLVDGATRRKLPPETWRFEGSRVLVEAPDRVVLESTHSVELAQGPLRIERFGYFKAGRRFFRLGINLVNLSEHPVTLHYGYGDEPWVGEFGSAAGNVGWVDGAIVRAVTSGDPRRSRWAGILDEKSGLANFVSWDGANAPDIFYFGNHAGSPKLDEIGAPLASNEISIALEWINRTIPPGGTLSLQLTLGVAGRRGDGLPAPPEGAITPR